jgi:nicotine blue oxidoreductase
MRRIVAAWLGGAGDIVAASYDGVRGHPLLIAQRAWTSVPDEGLRALEPAPVPCDDLGAPGDVDTPEDFDAL